MRRFFQALVTVVVDTHDDDPSPFEDTELQEAAAECVLVDVDDEGHSRFVGPQELRHTIAAIEIDWQGLKEITAPVESPAGG
jgi:hypothetical protein